MKGPLLSLRCYSLPCSVAVVTGCPSSVPLPLWSIPALLHGSDLEVLQAASFYLALTLLFHPSSQSSQQLKLVLPLNHTNVFTIALPRKVCLRIMSFNLLSHAPNGRREPEQLNSSMKCFKSLLLFHKIVCKFCIPIR